MREGGSEGTRGGRRGHGREGRGDIEGKGLNLLTSIIIICNYM